MNKDVVKNSIICLSNMKIEDTTYQIARDIVVQELEEKDKEIERLHSMIKEVREYIERDMKQYGGDIYITCKDILEILDKGE